MIPETENPQEAKSVYPGKPMRHAQADQGLYAETTMLVFSRDGSHVYVKLTAVLGLKLNNC